MLDLTPDELVIDSFAGGAPPLAEALVRAQFAQQTKRRIAA
jgi:hypothetical protein